MGYIAGIILLIYLIEIIRLILIGRKKLWKLWVLILLLCLIAAPFISYAAVIPIAVLMITGFFIHTKK